MERAKRTELRIRRQANETFVLHVNNVEAARGSPLPQKKISRKERKDRKEMKGGNGESAANVITHSPTGEQNVCPACEQRGAGSRQSPAAEKN